MSTQKLSLPSLLAALLCCVILLPAANAQQPQLPPVPPPTPASSPTIHLDAVVDSRSGPAAPSLQPGDFTLLDNKVPQPLASFQAVRGSDGPVHVVILIDSVNTRHENVAYERGEIDKFLQRNGGRLPYPTTLAILTDTGLVMQPAPTTDGNALSKSLDQANIGLRFLGRASGFFGADERMEISLKALQQLTAVETARPGRKLILWVSPGWPLLSGPNVILGNRQRQALFSTIVAISTRLRDARITLYQIDPLGASESLLRDSFYETFLKGVKKPGDAELGNVSLGVLATQSGGLVLNANNDVTALLARCVADADAFYTLSFTPTGPEQPGQYHQLDLRVGKPGLTARTRQSFYTAPPTERASTAGAK